MITVNQKFQQIHLPVKAFAVYKSVADGAQFYIEAYDIDRNGHPINAHPLSLAESNLFAKSLSESRELSLNYLQLAGLSPEHLLYTHIDAEGYAVWYTEPRKIRLNFIAELDIPCGEVSIPAMIWKAGKKELEVYAIKLKGDKKPRLDSPLYHAPFFNIYKDGEVCMGTVKTDFADEINLEDFISQWESYFFNSYFSHTMLEHIPVKTNIVQLWQNLVKSGEKFPENVLIPAQRTIKDLIL